MMPKSAQSSSLEILLLFSPSVIVPCPWNLVRTLEGKIG
jgi:hypothetical protein